MLNKIKYNIKKSLGLKFLKINVLISNSEGESFQTEIERLPTMNSSIFALDHKLTKEHGQRLYAFIDCAHVQKIEDVYHCSSDITGTWLIRILP